VDLEEPGYLVDCPEALSTRRITDHSWFIREARAPRWVERGRRESAPGWTRGHSPTVPGAGGRGVPVSLNTFV
jgi:hypothetical protein